MINMAKSLAQKGRECENEKDPKGPSSGAKASASLLHSGGSLKPNGNRREIPKKSETKSPRKKSEADSSSSNVGLLRKKEGGEGSGIKGHVTAINNASKKLDSASQRELLAKNKLLQLQNKTNTQAGWTSTQDYKDARSELKSATRDRQKAQRDAQSVIDSAKSSMNGKESGRSIKIKTSFKEASKSGSTPSVVRVMLIEEGLGNLNDCFYYTKECLKAAASIFEGKKAFADHPSSIEEEILPERSVRDIFGHYEDVEYLEVDDRGRLEANLTMMEGDDFEWARGLVGSAVEFSKKYPDGDFVGLSINASGAANSVPIDDFIKSYTIPKKALPKILEAQENGITEIKAVTALSDAVSCDLVTEAGAGGKILKMLEQEKKRMSKKINAKENKKEAQEKEAEAEAHESHEHEHEADGADGEGQDDGDGHDDAAQDEKLFKKMISQYLGKGMADDKEAMEMAKEAYEAHKEAGMEHKEAYEAAGKHMKMAKKIGEAMAAKKESKEHESESESHESDEKDSKEEKDGDDMPPAKKAPAKEAGALRAQVISLAAEVAALRESANKLELSKYLESKLAASKKPVSVTKKFRESIGNPKSKKEVDSMYNLFMKAYDTGLEETQGDDSVFTEKNSFRESGEGSGEAGSFADCVD